jgi:hypothetical protein
MIQRIELKDILDERQKKDKVKNSLQEPRKSGIINSIGVK